MEIELKYRIPDGDTAERIWEDSLFSEKEEDNSREELELRAIYYDTEQLDLARNEIAYRVRREGERHIATIKWKGKSQDGLHVREELAVPVADESPDIDIFMESDIGPELQMLLEGRELKELMSTRIRRRSFRIDTGAGIFEVSIDQGIVQAAGKTADVLEVEVELFSGEQGELLEIGRKLQEVYGLEPEDTSKYAKGMDMVCPDRTW